MAHGTFGPMRGLSRGALRPLLVASALLAAACSGGGGSGKSVSPVPATSATPTPTPTPSSSTVPSSPPSDPQTAVVEQTFLQQLAAGNFPPANLTADGAVPDFVPSSFASLQSIWGGRRPRSMVTGAHDEENLGFLIQRGGTFTGLEMQVSVYRPNDFILAPPAGSSSPSLLAVYGYPPNFSCFALGTVYAATVSGAASTYKNLLAIDSRCGAQKTTLIDMNDAFMAAYARPSAKNVPSIRTMVYTNDPNPTNTSVWHAEIYSYTDQQWKELAQATGTAGRGLAAQGLGIAIAVLQAPAGACPSLPTIAEDQVRLFNATARSFETLSASTSQGTTSAFITPDSPPSAGFGAIPGYTNSAACFHDDATATPLYAYADIPNYAWTLTSQSTYKPAPLSPQIGGIFGGMTSGPDGRLWFAVQSAAGPWQIQEIDPVTGAMKVLATPNVTRLFAVAAGPDGNIWFGANTAGQSPVSEVGRLTPDGTLSYYPTPSAFQGSVDITAGPDGNLWYIGAGQQSIGRVSTSGAITEFTVTSPGHFVSSPTAGPDGNIWFTERTLNQPYVGTIGRITPQGASTLFPIPSGHIAGSIVAAPDGNLWFSEDRNSIGRMTPSGSLTGEFPAPAQPTGITVGRDGAVWFPENTGTIGRMTLSGAESEYNVNAGSNGIGQVVPGPDGGLWFTNNNSSQIGHLTPY
ncbi:MAG: hypothetical protein JOZ24_09270 [Candidatus Eremiobacteraeota bacterium]|nr:hypothetical protein [Candidatus Eremiobacteraeota bacterium]